jgi:predicted metal-binding protein
VRKHCEGNVCRNYGTTWACPPAVGTVDECKTKCLSYSHALVFNQVFPLEDSFDFEGMRAGHAVFKQTCDKLYELVKPQTSDFLLLSNESCNRCEKCTYPDSPCRFPEKLFPSVESFGILVAGLAEAAKINYINGPNTVTYFGMLLSNN